MPVHEYTCRACETSFEELVFGDEKVVCPECKSAKVDKRFSTFAAHGESAPAAPAPGSCGTCGDPRGPGACRRN
ncbi:MAG: zinc ribbon domain-containing protein [Planctomycetes bacterium]|nr:zinc ribbon domain-containing protein [Planctomycetota bacterium]